MNDLLAEHRSKCVLAASGLLIIAALFVIRQKLSIPSPEELAGPRPQIPAELQASLPQVRIQDLWPEEPLPYEGRPLPGRPEVDMPIVQQIFAEAEPWRFVVE